jgi:hypothetical protein
MNPQSLLGRSRPNNERAAQLAAILVSHSKKRWSQVRHGIF